MNRAVLRGDDLKGTSSPFSVAEITKSEEWQAVCDTSSTSTFFHTPRWYRAFEASDPSARIRVYSFCFPDGARAVFPALLRSRLGGLWQNEESGPAGCYGGWIAERPLTTGEARAVAEFILAHARNLVWRTNPFDPSQAQIGGVTIRPDSTEVLDLPQYDNAATLLKHYHHSARKQINKGCRAGLKARIAEDWASWEAYYRVYEGRLRRWGKAATSWYPRELFHALWQDRADAVRLWVVTHDDRVVGGNMNFYHGKHCVEWHAAYDCDMFHCGVRNYLVDTILRDALERGYIWYDFNPSGGNEGSRRFKQTFGTESLRTDLLIYRRGLYASDGLRSAMRVARSILVRRGNAGAAQTTESKSPRGCDVRPAR